MLDLKTVRSTTESRLTLLQYLKTIDKLLEGASLKDIETIRISDNVIKLKFLFGDGSEILSEDIKTSGGGAGSVVETNDGTNGSKILGITIDGKRYSLLDYKTDAGDLLELIQGSDTVTVDLTSNGQRLEIHLDEIYKQSLVTRSELNKPIDLPSGVNLLTYNWDAYQNGTWFKGIDAQGMPEGTKGEFLIQLIKTRNTRFAIYLYNTDIYESHTGNYINYHYADKFEGWQKIQTDLNASFIKKFVPIYDKNIPEIAYGKENGINTNENIVSAKLAEQIKKYNHFLIDTYAGIYFGFRNDSDGITIINFFWTRRNISYQNYNYIGSSSLFLEGNKLIHKSTFEGYNYPEHPNIIWEPKELTIIRIYGGELV